MNSIELGKAIKFLKPTAEFSYQDADYLTIQWDYLDGDAPTIEEIEAAHLQLEQIKATEEANKKAKREAALAKLETLGLTEEDLKALGL